jgi:outer membrane protein OmpA-like peptidoglycan-associated protein
LNEPGKRDRSWPGVRSARIAFITAAAISTAFVSSAAYTAANSPKPPPPAAAPGPFTVNFDWDKSDITTEAAAILDGTVAAYQESGSAVVVLAGHTDRSGSDQYNMGLSQRRADAVERYLVSKDVPDSFILTQAFGETKPLVETAGGVREPRNRRVEITFDPGSRR